MLIIIVCNNDFVCLWSNVQESHASWVYCVPITDSLCEPYQTVLIIAVCPLHSQWTLVLRESLRASVFTSSQTCVWHWSCCSVQTALQQSTLNSFSSIEEDLGKFTTPRDPVLISSGAFRAGDILIPGRRAGMKHNFFLWDFFLCTHTHSHTDF